MNAEIISPTAKWSTLHKVDVQKTYDLFQKQYLGTNASDCYLLFEILKMGLNNVYKAGGMLTFI